MDREGLEQLFAPFGPVRVRAMFGGHSIYADNIMFALEADGEIFLKVDDQTKPAFEAQGLGPFVYESARGAMAMSYHRLPETAQEDEHVLCQWCALGLEAARRAAAAKTKKPRKSARKKSPARKRLYGPRKP